MQRLDRVVHPEVLVVLRHCLHQSARPLHAIHGGATLGQDLDRRVEGVVGHAGVDATERDAKPVAENDLGLRVTLERPSRAQHLVEAGGDVPTEVAKQPHRRLLDKRVLGQATSHGLGHRFQVQVEIRDVQLPGGRSRSRASCRRADWWLRMLMSSRTPPSARPRIVHKSPIWAPVTAFLSYTSQRLCMPTHSAPRLRERGRPVRSPAPRGGRLALR
jgi:hypothetical protein